LIITKRGNDHAAQRQESRGKTRTQRHVQNARRNQWKDVTTDDVSRQDRGRVLPAGAYTPTCSSTHLPRYNELAAVFKANGVDAIVCLSVNDALS